MSWRDQLLGRAAPARDAKSAVLYPVIAASEAKQSIAQQAEAWIASLRSQ
jgi:hypothetical protein